MIRRGSISLQIGVAVLVCTLLIGYGLWQSRQLIAGPIISISSPLNGASLSDTRIELTGSVHNVSFITLNGRQIYADPNGAISEDILLAEGYNVIQLTGIDKFGRKETRTLELVAREPASSDAQEIVRNNRSIPAAN